MYPWARWDCTLQVNLLRFRRIFYRLRSTLAVSVTALLLLKDNREYLNRFLEVFHAVFNFTFGSSLVLSCSSTFLWISREPLHFQCVQLHARKSVSPENQLSLLDVDDLVLATIPRLSGNVLIPKCGRRFLVAGLFCDEFNHYSQIVTFQSFEPLPNRNVFFRFYFVSTILFYLPSEKLHGTFNIKSREVKFFLLMWF